MPHSVALIAGGISQCISDYLSFEKRLDLPLDFVGPLGLHNVLKQLMLVMLSHCSVAYLHFYILCLMPLLLKKHFQNILFDLCPMKNI